MTTAKALCYFSLGLVSKNIVATKEAPQIIEAVKTLENAIKAGALVEKCPRELDDFGEVNFNECNENGA